MFHIKGIQLALTYPHNPLRGETFCKPVVLNLLRFKDHLKNVCLSYGPLLKIVLLPSWKVKYNYTVYILSVADAPSIQNIIASYK